MAHWPSRCSARSSTSSFNKCASSDNCAQGCIATGTSSYTDTTRLSIAIGPSRCKAATTLASRINRWRTSFSTSPTIGNHVTVPRCDRLYIVVQQSLEGVDVGFHIATGRDDHDSRAVHDVIASKHNPLLLEQKAEVIVDMTGCGDTANGPIWSLRKWRRASGEYRD